MHLFHLSNHTRTIHWEVIIISIISLKRMQIRNGYVTIILFRWKLFSIGYWCRFDYESSWKINAYRQWFVMWTDLERSGCLSYCRDALIDEGTEEEIDEQVDPKLTLQSIVWGGGGGRKQGGSKQTVDTESAKNANRGNLYYMLLREWLLGLQHWMGVWLKVL